MGRVVGEKLGLSEGARDGRLGRGLGAAERGRVGVRLGDVDGTHDVPGVSVGLAVRKDEALVGAVFGIDVKSRENKKCIRCQPTAFIKCVLVPI